MTGKKEISITISLGLEYIYFTFDEEKLNGYAIDEIERRSDVKEIKRQGYPKEIETLKIKEVYKEYYDRQRERKLVGKIKDRCIAVDLNPTNIGFSILDKTNDGIKIIHCGWFDMKRLCVKTGKASDSKEQRYLNNKRKYELTVVFKKLSILQSITNARNLSWKIWMVILRTMEKRPIGRLRIYGIET